MKKILRWRTASTSIKYGRNIDQTTASTWFSSVRSGSQNRTEIGVDRALTLTGTLDPGRGSKSVSISQDREDSGCEWKFPSSAAGRARQLFLTYTLICFCTPFSSEYSFMTKYRRFSLLQFLHQNLTHIVDDIDFKKIADTRNPGCKGLCCQQVILTSTTIPDV
jgi:hypothetical protein